MELSSISLCLYSFINVSKTLNVLTDFSTLFHNMESILALKMSKGLDNKSLSQIMISYSKT